MRRRIISRHRTNSSYGNCHRNSRLSFTGKFVGFVFSAIFLSCCNTKQMPVDDLCEVRTYHQQTLYAFSDSGRKARPGLSLAHNWVQLKEFNGWLVEGYVRVKEQPFFVRGRVSKIENISPDTTFLIVGVDDPLKYTFEGNKYFDGRYSNVGRSQSCPIYIGRRNGEFALAAIRRSSPEEAYEQNVRCDALATLTFFGLTAESLQDYHLYISTDPFREAYDIKAIKNKLDELKGCGGV